MKSIHILSTILLVIILIDSIQSAGIKTKSMFNFINKKKSLSKDVDENTIDKILDGCILNNDTSDSHYEQFCYKFIKEEFPEFLKSNYNYHFYYCVDECNKLHDIYADD
ncbi:hypothetical protein DERP_009246 [Dermatophagoides pteronyssinus]|uniref:Uncharacterized protein n=1 Tax=Dermatophagoides pteronyssinus TaxID=6956 RepID=A0ABQ8JRW0_DERPT|nr:hypothetical protein DERP_009246 [Dermatophagoides pteronyssinus]